jgi:hypothetical protein
MSTVSRLVILSFVALASACAQSTEGSLCVMAVEPPAKGEKSLANPAGGNRIQHYSVKVDDLPAVDAQADRGVALPPLSVADRHLVRIFGDGKQVESFRFRFDDNSTNDLCLVFKSFYETWSVIDCEDALKRGACHPRERLPWVHLKSCVVVGRRVREVREERGGVAFDTDYLVRYTAEGKEFAKYSSSGRPSDSDKKVAESRPLPKSCEFNIEYHPGLPDRAIVYRRY